MFIWDLQAHILSVKEYIKTAAHLIYECDMFN
jgi:hypothetical protein